MNMPHLNTTASKQSLKSPLKSKFGSAQYMHYVDPNTSKAIQNVKQFFCLQFYNILYILEEAIYLELFRKILQHNAKNDCLYLECRIGCGKQMTLFSHL